MGRGFAGYAPVLAALGTLIVQDDEDEGNKRKNYSTLLQHSGTEEPEMPGKFWKQWPMKFSTEKQKKVRYPLVTTLGSEIPAEAYDPADQLDLLAAHFAGRSFRPSLRLAFGSQAASTAYRKAVEVYHFPEHPFLHGNLPINDVLGALVVAHAIAKGEELSGGQGPKLLADYGRQPFLWRFIRHRLTPDTLIGGDVVAYVLGSLWTDDAWPRAAVTFGFDGTSPDVARLAIETGGSDVSAGVLLPLFLRGDRATCESHLPEERSS